MFSSLHAACCYSTTKTHSFRNCARVHPGWLSDLLRCIWCTVCKCFQTMYRSDWSYAIPCCVPVLQLRSNRKHRTWNICRSFYRQQYMWLPCCCSPCSHVRERCRKNNCLSKFHIWSNGHSSMLAKCRSHSIQGKRSSCARALQSSRPLSHRKPYRHDAWNRRWYRSHLYRLPNRRRYEASSGYSRCP